MSQVSDTGAWSRGEKKSKVFCRCCPAFNCKAVLVAIVFLPFLVILHLTHQHFDYIEMGEADLYPPVVNSSINSSHLRTTLHHPVDPFLEDFAKYCRSKTPWYPPDVNSNLPLCPCIPRHLVGLQKLNLPSTIPTWEEVDKQFTNIPEGGHYRPPDCVANHRTAIIVPFRQRDAHLRQFLSHMHPFLQRQEIDYWIIVVEQANFEVFNKGMMMNIGFVEAVRMYNFDCFVFHDVDLLPENDYNICTCSSEIRHMAASWNIWNYTRIYDGFFGGAIALSKEQYKRANGFSNLLFGWAAEDDDMHSRVDAEHMKVVSYPDHIARYTMIKHKPDKGNPLNMDTQPGSPTRKRVPKDAYKTDGLTTLKYKIRKMEHRKLYTWIYAEIPPPQHKLNLKPFKDATVN